MRLITRILGVVLLVLTGHAQTIASYTGAAAPTGVINTPVLVGTTPVTLLYSAGAPVLSGAQYVTYKQGSAPTGVTTYTTTFPAVAGATGSLQVMCDDTCSVTLNGALLGSVTSYNTVSTFAVPALLGTNKLSIVVTNAVGNTGVAFIGKITVPVTQVKPPTSLGTFACTGTITYTIYDNGTATFTLPNAGSCVKQ